MNQVTEKKNGALATFDMEADAQQGAQNISQEDLALPFLKILGQLSPEVNKRDGKYVEGAEPGKIINTVTNALYDSPSMSYHVIIRDNTLNGKIEAHQQVVTVAIHMKQIVISLVKRLEVKTIKIDYQMVIILIILLIILYL